MVKGAFASQRRSDFLFAIRDRMSAVIRSGGKLLEQINLASK